MHYITERLGDPTGTQELSTEIHHGVECNLCRAKPIHGMRYKCLECSDFDLCRQCYSRFGHRQHRVERRLAKTGKTIL